MKYTSLEILYFIERHKGDVKAEYLPLSRMWVGWDFDYKQQISRATFRGFVNALMNICRVRTKRGRGAPL